MIDETYIKNKILNDVLDNKSFKIKDMDTFKSELCNLNVKEVVDSFNNVLQDPEWVGYQLNKSWDLYYDLGNKFLKTLLNKKIVETTGYDEINILFMYGNEPLHKL